MLDGRKDEWRRVWTDGIDRTNCYASDRAINRCNNAQEQHAATCRKKTNRRRKKKNLCALRSIYLIIIIIIFIKPI